MIHYNLTRSRRKTIAIYVRGGAVDVRAPLRASLREIDSFVASKEKWILKNLAVLFEKSKRQEDFAKENGGKNVQLKEQYIKKARSYIPLRVEEFSKIMNVTPAAVKINSAKCRWGSCSAKKSLNFSWRLAMADDDVIDYVIVHELAHILQMNHSAEFWGIVRNILPDYKLRQKRLKELHKRLSNENREENQS